MLFFVDISERCGFTLGQQLSLFESLKPLFASKPLVVVATKIDITPLDAMSPEGRARLDKAVEEAGAVFLTMSNVTEVRLPLCHVTCGSVLPLPVSSLPSFSYSSHVTLCVPCGGVCRRV